MTPVGLPVEMMIPPSTRKVSCAQLTRAQPVKSLPLKSGTKPSASGEAAEAQPNRRTEDRAISGRMSISLEGAERVLAILQRKGDAAAREMSRVHGEDHLERRARFVDIDGGAI